MQSRKTISQEDTFRAVDFDEFLVISKQGKSKGYELLNSGLVKSVLVGGRRLVFIQSWYDYLGRLLEEQSTFTPGRHPIRWPNKPTPRQPLPRRGRHQDAAVGRLNCIRPPATSRPWPRQWRQRVTTIEVILKK